MNYANVILEKIKAQTKKRNTPITRQAFVYMAPKAPKDQFAQCGTCISFIEDNSNEGPDDNKGKDQDRCAILGPDVRVDENWSCSLYVHGKPTKKVIPIKRVSPEEAGLVKSEVRCENCFYFDSKGSECVLYQDLNKQENFKLDTKVEAKGCCNAWTPK